jgi:hypothetical protein
VNKLAALQTQAHHAQVAATLATLDGHRDRARRAAARARRLTRAASRVSLARVVSDRL